MNVFPSSYKKTINKFIGYLYGVAQYEDVTIDILDPGMSQLLYLVAHAPLNQHVLPESSADWSFKWAKEALRLVEGENVSSK